MKTVITCRVLDCLVLTANPRYCGEHEAAMKRLHDMSEAKPPDPRNCALPVSTSTHRLYVSYGYGAVPR